MLVACQFCDKIHEKSKYRALNNKNIFCSKLCYQKNRTKNKKPREQFLMEKRNKERMKKGLPITEDRMRAKNGNGNINNGYRVLYKPEFSRLKSGRISEHALIMSTFLKRKLNNYESVHHKNGIRHDNRLENLELWNCQHPYGQRVEDKIKFYKEFLEQYGHQVILKQDGFSVS